MVVLGVLSHSPRIITDELFAKVLQTARDSLVAQANDESDQFLSLAVLSCMHNIFPYLSPSSPYFTPMFWLAMTLAQVNDSKMFSSSLSFLEVILQTLDNNGAFDTQMLGEIMLGIRTGPLEAYLTQLDQVTGISFATSFSFAVSAHLLKGLKHAQTKTQTLGLLKYLVDISTKQSVGPNALGYLAALLPAGGADSLRTTVLPTSESVAGEGQYQLLFSKEMLTDTLQAALLFSTLVTILRHSEIEHEKLFIYEALKEGVQVMPQAFPTIYDTLLQKMTGVITSAQHSDIVSAVLSILQFMCGVYGSSDRLDRSYLSKIGFGGLSLEGDSFFGSEPTPKSIQRRKQILKIAGHIIDSILVLEEK